MTGVVLAGGESKRMGQNKAFIPVGGRPIIERVIGALSVTCDPVIIVTNCPTSYVHLGVEMVSDLFPGHGALGGIHAGLFFSPTPRAFFVACDMPLVNPSVVQLLMEKSPKWEVVVPRIGEFLEPLHAVYSKASLRKMEEFLESGGRKILDLYPKLKVLEVNEEEIRRLDPRLLSFMNVNTPEDLERVLAVAGHTHAGSSL